MASIVHKFVHVHAADEGSRAFLGADEVDRQQQQEPGEYRPREQFANWNGGGRESRREYRPCHVNLLGLRVPLERPDHEGGLALQWRDRAGIAPASALREDDGTMERDHWIVNK
jgi:hypothetical protein